MKIRRIELHNFRNHSYSLISLNNIINVIYGPNGSGKTSILEAISVASLTRTFSNASDSNLIKFGENNYQIKVKTKNYLGLDYSAEVNYDKLNGKRIKNSFSDNVKSKDLIGLLPIVFLSPDLKIITSGSPENRREFIDRVLSQSSKNYVEDIIKFKRSLKQRNSLLNNLKINKTLDKNGFEIWTELFINLSEKIIIKRKEFVDEFNVIFQKYYHKITSNTEQVSIQYSPNSIKNFDKSIEAQLREKADKTIDSELNRFSTLFGPQKDELKIQLNSGSARDWASQGQHKSILIAIKLAEFDYLQKFSNELPVVLLDDIFSELDEYRSLLVLNTILDNQAQTLITMTNPELIQKNSLLRDAAEFIRIENGEIY